MMASLLRAFIIVFACLVSDSVLAAPCEAERISECSGGIDMESYIANPDNNNRDAMCRMMTCIQSLDGKCALPNNIKAAMSHVHSTATACTSTVSDSLLAAPCEAERISECSGGIDMESYIANPDNNNRDAMCRMMTCIQNLDGKCALPNNIKAVMSHVHSTATACTGGTGTAVAVQPTLAILFGLMFAVVTFRLNL